MLSNRRGRFCLRIVGDGSAFESSGTVLPSNRRGRFSAISVWSSSAKRRRLPSHILPSCIENRPLRGTKASSSSGGRFCAYEGDGVGADSDGHSLVSEGVPRPRAISARLTVSRNRSAGKRAEPSPTLKTEKSRPQARSPIVNCQFSNVNYPLPRVPALCANCFHDNMDATISHARELL